MKKFLCTEYECEYNMKVDMIVENWPATRGARANAMGNTKREFPDNEPQKSSCMNAV